jgi:16S rRNA (uracil1498-N3)-methyltransferase
MPATPAWPPASLPRLYVDMILENGLAVDLDGPAANYLGAVLRLGSGDEVKLFDNRTGEWLARVEQGSRKKVRLSVLRRLREREEVPDLWLLFAPIKRGRIDWVVERATELGVALLQPVLTRRTIVDRINEDRLRAHIIEAAEQCERTALPVLEAARPLDKLLQDWPADRNLYFADESGGAPLVTAAAPGPAAILIGPEGGFTEAERASIRQLARSRPVSLGPRILRADTAAVAAIGVWMATAGDWHRHASR